MNESAALSLLVLCFSVCVSVNAQWVHEALLEDDVTPETYDESIFWANDSDENVVILTVPNTDIYESPDYNRNIENTLDNDIGPPQTPADIPLIYTIEVLAEKVQSLISQVNAQESKITALETSYKTLEDKMDLIEQQTKTNNVLFFNVKEDKRESHKVTLQKVLSIINRQMRVRVSARDVSVALRAGGNSTQVRPIIVRFTNFDIKMKVLAMRNRLIHSKIVVVGDYSEKVAKKRIELLPYLQSARNQGHQAFILYDKLVVNGVKKTLEDLQAEDLSRKQLSDDDVLETRDHETTSSEDPKEQVEDVEVPPEVSDYE